MVTRIADVQKVPSLPISQRRHRPVIYDQHIRVLSASLRDEERAL
jgi:hypothetical protein